MATNHLVLTTHHINSALTLSDELKSQLGALYVALIDAQGRLICHTEPAHAIDEASLGALSAAAMAAHQSLARLIGEENFPEVTHRGQRRAVHLCLLAHDAIWVIIFAASLTNAELQSAIDAKKQKIDALLKEAHKVAHNALADVSSEDIDNLLR